MHSAFATAVKTAGEEINPLLPAVPDLVWGGIIFAGILFFFIRFVVPRLNAALDARSEAIAGGLERAEKAQAEANAARDSYNDQLAEARAEAARIRDQARQDGQKIIAEAREQALVEASRVNANAQAQIEAERSAALTSLRTEVGSLALGLASTVIGESLTDDKRSASIVDRFLADLETADAAAAAAKR